MSDKIATLKEKFRLALTSTAKVISDDFDLINKSSENDKTVSYTHLRAHET